MSTAVELLERRIAEIRSSREGAEKAGKWTAVSTLSAAEDKLLGQLLEAQAEEAEQLENAQAELSAEELLAEIERLCMALPSYLVDELIERLEQCRVTEDPRDWVVK